jgi:hypothetical protein
VEEFDKAFADDAVVFNDADFGHRGIEQEVTERTEEINRRGAKARRLGQRDKKGKIIDGKIIRRNCVSHQANKGNEGDEFMEISCMGFRIGRWFPCPAGR